MKKLTLILGGIRSGKSVFGEQKAEYYSKTPIYIATAIPFDKEMQQRVEIHQSRRRDKSYQTFEAPTDIRGILRQHPQRTILVDCMTLHLSNRMFQTGDDLVLTDFIKESDQYLEEIAEIILKNQINLILISNEVGLCPVEMNKLSRQFQDLQGRWNRKLAELADEVYFVTAGLPRSLKKNPVRQFKLGCPSYILPTGYIENVTFAIDHVEDVQLLLFDSENEDPLFKEETRMTLDYLARDGDLTYSVHMHTSPSIFSEEGFENRISKAVQAIEKLKSLPISGYTFHYDLPEELKNITPEKKEAIDQCYIRFFKELTHQLGSYTPLLTLENTATPISWLDTVIKETGLHYCIDLGHLQNQNFDLDEVKERLPHTKIIHLHGIETINGKQKDHRALNEDVELFQEIENFNGVVTIENYHKKLLFKSLETLNTYF